MTTKDIIEDSLRVGLYDETSPKDFFGKLLDFRKKPTDSELKSRSIIYLSNRIAQESMRAAEAERDADITIMQAIHIMEQYSPEATMKLWELRNKRIGR